jgi:hypothetical protein
MSAPTITCQFDYSSSLIQPVYRLETVKKLLVGREGHSRAISNALRAAADDAFVSISNLGAYASMMSDILNQSTNAVSAPLPRLSSQSLEQSTKVAPKENASVIALLNRWMADTSGYDQEFWPEIERAIEENRSSYRKRFNG